MFTAKNIVGRLELHCYYTYGHCNLLLCRPLLELIPKEKVAGLPVFTQALRLVPFAMPEHWSGPRLCEDLPGLLHDPACPVILVCNDVSFCYFKTWTQHTQDCCLERKQQWSTRCMIHRN